MAAPENAAVDAGALMPVITAVVPVVLGGVATYFKLFLPSQEGFRKRVQLKRTALSERMAVRLATLLQHVRSLAPDDCLRGDGREEPDLVWEYSAESFRTFDVYHRLEVLNRLLRRAYCTLYVTIACGVVAALMALLVPLTRTGVLVVSLVLIAVQIITVLIMQVASWRLTDYESTT